MVHRSARGSLILILGQIISTVIAAVGSILVARFLGSTSYGEVTLAIIPVNIANLFRNIGVSAALVKYIAQYRSEKNEAEIRILIRAGLLLNSASGLLLSLVTFLLSGFLATKVFHQPELETLIEIASVTLLAQSLINTSYSTFVGFERMEFRSMTLILQSILKSFIAPALVLLDYGVFGAILGYTIPLVVTGVIGVTIVAFGFMKYNGSGRAMLGHYQACKLLLGYGYPLFLSSLFTGALTQLYNFLMALYVDVSMIGNYKAATNFYVLIAFLTVPIATVLFPLFSKIDAGDNSLLSLVFKNSVKYAALVTVPITACLMVLSHPVVRIIYGSSYQHAPLLLRLYIFNYLFVGMGNITVGNFLNGQGKTRITFLQNLMNLCIGVPLSIIMIQSYGIVGILLTMIIAPKAGFFFALWWIRKNFGFTFNWVSSAKIYVSVGVASLLAYSLLATTSLGDWVDLLLGGGLFILAYSLLVPLTGALERDDIQNLRNITSAMGPLAPLFNMFLSFFEKLTKETRS
jgi:stage V sporulation protein B